MQMLAAQVRASSPPPHTHTHHHDMYQNNADSNRLAAINVARDDLDEHQTVG